MSTPTPAAVIVIFDAVFDSGPGFMVYAVPTEHYRDGMNDEEAERYTIAAPCALGIPDDFFND
jgi:hypothetical protein